MGVRKKHKTFEEYFNNFLNEYTATPQKQVTSPNPFVKEVWDVSAHYRQMLTTPEYSRAVENKERLFQQKWRQIAATNPHFNAWSQCNTKTEQKTYINGLSEADQVQLYALVAQVKAEHDEISAFDPEDVKQIILATWQLYSIVPKSFKEARDDLKKLLANYLQMDEKVPATDEIKDALKARGYLVPMKVDGILRTKAETEARILEGYRDAITNSAGYGTREAAQRASTPEYVQKMANQLSAFRATLSQLNNNLPLTPLDQGFVDWNELGPLQTAINEHNTSTTARYRASADTVLTTLRQFSESPYSAALGRKLGNLWGSVSRLFHPKEWGQPDLEDTVYQIACIINAIGNRKYLNEADAYCFGKHAKDEHGNKLTHQQRLERFLAFLTKQFLIIEATPLSNLDDERKRTVLLRELKQLINRYSELAHLSTRLRLDKTDKENPKHKVELRKAITYEKRRGRIIKSMLKFGSDAMSVFVALGQAILTYYAIVALVPALPALLALIPPLVPFIPVIVPVLGPFLIVGCTLATLYTNTILFKADTWGAIKQFAYKWDFFNGRETTGGKIAMGLVLVGALIMGLVMGFLIFNAAAASFGVLGPAAFLAAPVIATFVTAIGVATALIFTAIMYQATAALASTIAGYVTSVQAALAKNRLDNDNELVVVGKTIGAYFAHLWDLWKNPIRVPNPLDPSETIPDVTAKEDTARKNEQRIKWIVGALVSTVFYGLGALLGIVASVAVLGTFHTEITDGLKLWFGLAPAVTMAISGATVWLTCGIINSIFNLRGCKNIASYCGGLATDYIAAPIATTVYKAVTDPIGLVVGAAQGIAKGATSTWKFCTRLITDPQRTVAPIVDKTVRVLVDMPLIVLNAFANFALILKKFVVGDNAPGLTANAITQSVASFVNSAGVNLVQFNGAEDRKMPTEVTPVYQAPVKPRSGEVEFAPIPTAPTTPSISVEAAKALPPAEQKTRLRESNKRIYTNKKLAANFTFFAEPVNGSIPVDADNKAIRNPQPLHFNQEPLEVARQVIASPCA